MKRSVPYLLASALLIGGGVPAALAATPTRVGVDKEHQVSFSMTGPTVIVTLRPVDGETNPIADKLDDKDVVLFCRGTDPNTGRERTAKKRKAWLAGATDVAIKLSSDVSDHPRWCVLEKPDGTDIAVTLKLRVVNPQKTA